MEINYCKNTKTGIEYSYQELTEVLALSNGLFYSFPVSESKVNHLDGSFVKRITTNPFEFELLKEAAKDFNYRKGKEITSKIKNFNGLEKAHQKI